MLWLHTTSPLLGEPEPNPEPPWWPLPPSQPHFPSGVNKDDHTHFCENEIYTFLPEAATEDSSALSSIVQCQQARVLERETDIE